MSGENLKSNPVTNADATPIVAMSMGQGAPGRMHVATDTIAVTTNVAQWSTYRLCRFPVAACIKHVRGYVSGIDSNTTATAKYDINVAFSDATNDGTQPQYQGTIPSSKNDGTSLAFVAGTGYSTSYQNSGTGNKLFGSAVAGSNSGATQSDLELTFKNSFTPANRDDELWDVLGFVDGNSVAQSPGGFFDIFIVVEAAVATAAAGTFAVEIDYAG